MPNSHRAFTAHETLLFAANAINPDLAGYLDGLETPALESRARNLTGNIAAIDAVLDKQVDAYSPYSVLKFVPFDLIWERNTLLRAVWRIEQEVWVRRAETARATAARLRREARRLRDRPPAQ